MQAIKVQPGQSLLDVAITAYGKADAALLLLAANYQTLRTADDPDGAELDLAGELLAGTELTLSENPTDYDRAALRELDGAIVATKNPTTP